MLRERSEFDTLGVEALPGGLAEILRTLQPTLSPAIATQRKPQTRGFGGFFGWRRVQRDAT